MVSYRKPDFVECGSAEKFLAQGWVGSGCGGFCGVGAFSGLVSAACAWEALGGMVREWRMEGNGRGILRFWEVWVSVWTGLLVILDR